MRSICLCLGFVFCLTHNTLLGFSISVKYPGKSQGRMATCKPRKQRFFGADCPGLVSPPHIELQSSPGSDSAATKDTQEDAKSVIETTLLKSAGILSDFTTHTISKTSAYFDHILAPERFGFSPLFQSLADPVPATTHRPNSNSSNSKPKVGHTSTGKKKPDIITKLPTSIVKILKDDSNSSIPSMNKSKKYNYHSKKMALKQRDDSKEKVPHLNASTESTPPKIVIVSAPLALEQNEEEMSMKSENNNSSQTKVSIQDNFPHHHKETNDMISNMQAHLSTKTDKKVGASFHVTSAVRKPDKLNIGVDKGVVFILGSKSKSPYFNTFGNPDIDVEDSGLQDVLSNRKWVVNVGNFFDEEISLVLVGNNLTITGFRQPSLNYPEGQTVSETIPLPADIDINNLRVYRSHDAKAFLVIQEKRQLAQV